MRWRRISTILVTATILSIIYFIYQLDSSIQRPRKIQKFWIVQPTVNQSMVIPKLFWAYWSSEIIPSFYINCVKGWKKSNPDYNTTILTRSTLQTFLSVRLPVNFDNIRPEFQADWVRLAILLEYGGFWVDASFFITQEIAFIHKLQEAAGSESFMFYSEPFTTDPAYPYFENWFIATIPHGRLITAWFLEFSRCYETFGMEDLYLESLRNEFGEQRYQNLVQGNNAPSYLKQHITLQKVLQIDHAPIPTGLSSQDPLYGPFSILSKVDWDPWRYVDEIFTKPWTGDVPALLKLRKYDRYIILYYLRRRNDWLGLLWEFAIIRKKMDKDSIFQKVFHRIPS